MESDIEYYIKTGRRLRQTAAEMLALKFDRAVVKNILAAARAADRAADALLLHAKAAAA